MIRTAKKFVYIYGLDKIASAKYSDAILSSPLVYGLIAHQTVYFLARGSKTAANIGNYTQAHNLILGHIHCNQIITEFALYSCRTF